MFDLTFDVTVKDEIPQLRVQSLLLNLHDTRHLSGMKSSSD